MADLKLEEMTETEFDHFLKCSAEAYSKECARCYGVNLEQVQPKTEKEIREMLPKGRQTKGHYFYHLKNSNKENLGWLWLMVRENFGKKRLFICDIYVEENMRGQGCGKFMMNWAENKAKEMNLSEVALHVFGHNQTARKLYEALGYTATNVNMVKKV